MFSLVDLPQDILDRILNSLHGFATLGACILSCKALYDAYAARPLSIRKSVIENSLGSGTLFRLAMQTIRAEQRLAVGAKDRPADVVSMRALMMSMRDTKYGIGDVAPSDVSRLAERIQVSAGFENMYSQRFKDKHYETSCLGLEQSDAFRTALLRVWLVGTFAYSGRVGVDAWYDWDFRNEFLYSPLSEQELYELLLVLTWLMEALENEVDDVTPFDTLFSIGFKGFLNGWQTRDFKKIKSTSEFLELFWRFHDDIGMLWTERDFNEVSEGDLEKLRQSRSLRPFAEYTGLLRACTKCDKVEGKDPMYDCLYNSENWLAKKALAAIPYNHLPFYLSRDLSRNSYETGIFGKYLFNPLHEFGATAKSGDMGSSGGTVSAANTNGNNTGSPVKGKRFDIYEIMRSLFYLIDETESETLRKHLSLDAFSRITTYDLLCQSCIFALFEARLWIWWYNHKSSGRARGCVINEDCWHGIACQAQKERDGKHAEKYNHLCLNTYSEKHGQQVAEQPS
ncbi:hypothetical protein AURDEDRAFT_164902 [Auricularia subglabra TFB-10046 SS5]|nr:hypothetical protein AURDEDRAFT_164902 [Auricularia subglabra TFB-10046 SS5]